MNSPSNENKKHEICRLMAQANTWEPEAERLFDQIGVRPGWRCIDLGCGPVGVLSPLSQRVGVHGQVFGFDEDPDCISAAESLIDRSNLTNVKIIKGNLYNNSLKSDSFDLCHLRFVFNQEGCDQELLQNMVTLTRPGGVVVSQESDWTTWKCYPRQPSWSNLRDAMIALFKQSGGDINAGLRTFKMFHQAHLTDIKIRSAILAMPVGHPYRSGLIRFALTMKERILAAGILTESAFNQNIEACQEMIKDPSIIIFSYTLTQVWGLVRS
jgi:SAM-dependent methyltransferase